jgi:hypothetical protein
MSFLGGRRHRPRQANVLSTARRRGATAGCRTSGGSAPTCTQRQRATAIATLDDPHSGAYDLPVPLQGPAAATGVRQTCHGRGEALERPAVGLAASRADGSRLAALSSSHAAPLRTPPPPCQTRPSPCSLIHRPTAGRSKCRVPQWDGVTVSGARHRSFPHPIKERSTSEPGQQLHRPLQVDHARRASDTQHADRPSSGLLRHPTATYRKICRKSGLSGIL